MYLTAPATVAAMLLVLTGLSWPLVARTPLAPAERLLVAVGSSLIAVFLFAWTVYTIRLPAQLLWLLPVAAFGGLVAGRKAFRALAADADVRVLAAGQGIVTLWCIGWLATVRSYSGGGWAGDWFEHWERMRFFVERWPLDTKFLGLYLLPARPPLVNVVTGVFVYFGRSGFAGFQLVTTVLGSLAFLPAALFARRWGGRRAVFIAAAVFMLNPLFIQNATFAWTKLPAAFLVLASLWFFVRSRDADPPAAAPAWWSAFMAAAILAHYSAAPYALVIGAVWLARGIARTDAAWRRQTLVALLTGLALLAPWFGWSASIYGGAGTYLSNTSVTAEDVHSGSQLAKVALNIVDSIVPHFLRPIDRALIAQASAWGWWRDWFFQSYQLNLFLALGATAWMVVAREAWRAAPAASAGVRRFWTGFVLATVLLGIGVHGARDHWGLTHICLQPLVLLGLVFLAGRWRQLGRGWRAVAVIGAAVDLTCGIGLHFAVQSQAVERWLHPELSPGELIQRQNWAAQMNFGGKAQHGLRFLSDTLAAPVATGLALAAIAVVLLVACARTRVAVAESAPSAPPAPVAPRR